MKQTIVEMLANKEGIMEYVRTGVPSKEAIDDYQDVIIYLLKNLD